MMRAIRGSPFRSRLLRNDQPPEKALPRFLKVGMSAGTSPAQCSHRSPKRLCSLRSSYSMAGGVVEPEKGQRDDDRPPLAAGDGESADDGDIARVERVAHDGIGAVGGQFAVLGDESAGEEPQRGARDDEGCAEHQHQVVGKGGDAEPEHQHHCQHLSGRFVVPQFADKSRERAARREIIGAV